MTHTIVTHASVALGGTNRPMAGAPSGRVGPGDGAASQSLAARPMRSAVGMGTMPDMNRPSPSSRIFLLADRRPASVAGSGPVARYRLARLQPGAGAAQAGRRLGDPKRV
jgi:hypothetical protein